MRNPFYSVLALVIHLVALAGLFLLLYAQFIAAAQIVVYAGAVMVLYVFVAAYVGAVEEPPWEPSPAPRVAGCAGGVRLLYVFVGACGGAVEEPLWEPVPGQRFLAPMLAAALL